MQSMFRLWGVYWHSIQHDMRLYLTCSVSTTSLKLLLSLTVVTKRGM